MTNDQQHSLPSRAFGPRGRPLRGSGFLAGALGAALLFVFVACAAPSSEEPGPPPTPTALLAPYNDAVATAEAGGDRLARAQAYYDRGNALLDQGDNAGAIADYDRALAIDAANARAFNNRALARAALGQADQALADYSRALAIDPRYVRAYTNRLRLLEQRGDLKGVAA